MRIFSGNSTDGTLVSGKIGLADLSGLMEKIVPANDDDPETGYRRTAFVGYAALALLCVVGALWMGTAPLAGAVIAQGSVAVDGRPKAVQHPEGGVISEIAVDNGSMVEEGQTVLQLDDSLLRAELNIVVNRLTEALATRMRLRAERDGEKRLQLTIDDFHALDIDPPAAVLKAQETLFKTRGQIRDGERSQLSERVSQLRHQLIALEFRRLAAEKQVNLMAEELEGLETLDKKGLGSKRRLREAKARMEQLRAETGEASAEKARVQDMIKETEFQILQVDWKESQTVLTALKDVELEIKNLTQQLLATRTRLAATDIRAPVSGIVHDLSVYTEGGVAQKETTLMEIVPQSERLEVEVRVEPHHIDQVFIGQAAAVRFSAFNQRQTPEVSGEVEAISPHTVADANLGSPYYLARIAISEDERARLDNVELKPGMPVEVFVKTEERTALNFLFKPLTDHMNRAFREE